MKWTLLTLMLTALITLALAYDGNSICEVQGFKISFSKVSDCCLKNTGGSNFKNNTLYCTLPVSKEGSFRNFVVTFLWQACSPAWLSACDNKCIDAPT
ncbi:hypothetical protein K450DRAFT_253801 [Umbelopsis ramanniana AG]|uniref:Uncharacterized protein n=1 Tax=Umbelopsis ramanniana AG TaxID=1314678 RepID=A0AAD5HAJ0_UMBRA|nr:uncharacterized protein K450DRAFT_253801 [Umbelopsis ramanniana AG]KAI8577140.1 hypothetical protein K450DRAFT_253801 [Umbelopsis ramanniana AG]